MGRITVLAKCGHARTAPAWVSLFARPFHIGSASARAVKAKPLRRKAGCFRQAAIGPSVTRPILPTQTGTAKQNHCSDSCLLLLLRSTTLLPLPFLEERLGCEEAAILMELAMSTLTYLADKPYYSSLTKRYYATFDEAFLERVAGCVTSISILFTPTGGPRTCTEA